MIDVMVVDDSAVVRQVIAAVLSQGGGFNVRTAADPLIAMSKMGQDRPDVIVLDLEMPRMDGVTFLRKIMASDNPIPVIVCSGVADQGSRQAITALEEGALAVIAKPKVGVRDFLHESAVTLIDAVRGAAQARLRRRTAANAPAMAVVPRLSADAVLPRKYVAAAIPSQRIVAIGASTGGTEALAHILQSLSPDCPGIVIVQHMPEGFTRAFAQRLDQICPIRVKEAENGDCVVPGQALIARGNSHLLVRRATERYIVQLNDGPLVSRHRPSVDVLFRSVAQSAGASGLGIILTGMGDDGADGLLEMKQTGARTIAQNERTCVVFGMPREAVERGAVNEVLPLHDIAGAVNAYV
ncbi:MAG: chemotaxis response regulator protein-glutamate methylesterase [Acidobacteriales bacterium]|nr:chemotaxis response regulator protein-glutamate methylesterase [Terriglobales bacterium]